MSITILNITILKIIINVIGFLATYFAWNIPSLLFGIVMMFISILIPRDTDKIKEVK